MLLEKHKFINNTTIIISFFLFSLLYIYFFVKSGYLMVGSDRMFHLERMEEAYQTLKNDHIISYVSTYSFARIGQAINVFYPSLNLVPYALIRIVMTNEVHAFYFFMFLEQFIGLIIAFYSGKIILKSIKGAYLFAITLRFSLYILYNDFVRCDIGESWALLFVPMALAGLYMILKDDNNNFEGALILTISLIFELCCHIITTIITIVIIVVCYVVYFLFISKSRSKFYALVTSGLLFTLGTLFITVPIVNTMLTTKINKPDINMFSSYNLPMFTLLGNSLNNELSINASPNIGLVLVITLIVGFIFLQRKDKLMNFIYFCSLLLTIMVTNLFPWQLFEKTSLVIIQFPWRLLVIVVVLLSLFFAYLIIAGTSSLKIILLVLMLIFTTTISAQQQFIREQYSNYRILQSHKVIENGWGLLLNKESLDKIKSKNMISSFSSRSLDYLPQNSVAKNKDIFEHRIKVNSEEQNIRNSQIVSGYQSVTYNLYMPNNKVTLTLPFIIYDKKNYKVYQNGKEIKFTVARNSTVKVKKSKGIENVQYKVKFNTPIFWKIANCISIITFIAIIGLLIYLMKNKIMETVL